MISSYPPAIRRHLLSKHFLISTMPERALNDLVKFTTVARCEPHRVIFDKGDPGDCLYGILSGRVRIYCSSPEGDEIILNVLEEGSCSARSRCSTAALGRRARRPWSGRICCAFTAPTSCHM